MAITGSIQQKNGKWYAVLNLQDVSGKRKQKWINSGLNIRGNKKKAEQFLEEQLEKFSENSFGGTDIFFAEYLEKWLPKIQKEVRPNTFRTYNMNMHNHIIPYFREKGIKLHQLCPVNLENYYKEKVKEGLSKTTVKHHHQVISKALTDAVRERLIIHNPASAAKTPTPNTFEASFLTPRQLEQLLILIKGTVIELPVQLCSIYGFRRSEVLGLRWAHVDFDGRTLTVAETLQQHTGGCYVDEPKTDKSFRTLPLTEQAFELLAEQKTKQSERAKIMGGFYLKSDYVCTWPDGRIILPNYLSKSFHKILKDSDLPMVRLHDLRHSTASNLIDGNMSIVRVSNWLGHSSPTTTLNYYSHVNRKQKEEVAAVIDKMVSVK